MWIHICGNEEQAMQENEELFVDNYEVKQLGDMKRVRLLWHVEA